MCGSDIFLGILAVFFPPVSVWIKVGICTADSIINLALCCLGYVPGLLHAWYIILKHPEPDYDGVVYEPISGSAAHGHGGDVENGNVRYYYVSRDTLRHPSQRGYGTVGSPQPQSQNSQPAPKQQHQQRNNDGSGESSSQGQDESRAPPTYAEAVRADNKIQSQDE